MSSGHRRFDDFDFAELPDRQLQRRERFPFPKMLGMRAVQGDLAPRRNVIPPVLGLTGLFPEDMSGYHAYHHGGGATPGTRPEMGAS
jgi:hypothetical protein